MYKHLILMVSLLALTALLTEQQPVKANQDLVMDQSQENIINDSSLPDNQMQSLGGASEPQQQLTPTICHECRKKDAFVNVRDLNRTSVQVNVSNPVILAHMLLSLLSEISFAFFEEADPDMSPFEKVVIKDLVIETLSENLFNWRVPPTYWR